MRLNVEAEQQKLQQPAGVGTLPCHLALLRGILTSVAQCGCSGTFLHTVQTPERRWRAGQGLVGKEPAISAPSQRGQHQLNLQATIPHL